MKKVESEEEKEDESSDEDYLPNDGNEDEDKLFSSDEDEKLQDYWNKKQSTTEIAKDFVKDEDGVKCFYTDKKQHMKKRMNLKHF